jgi:hypothetical protein
VYRCSSALTTHTACTVQAVCLFFQRQLPFALVAKTYLQTLLVTRGVALSYCLKVIKGVQCMRAKTFSLSLFHSNQRDSTSVQHYKCTTGAWDHTSTHYKYITITTATNCILPPCATAVCLSLTCCVCAHTLRYRMFNSSMPPADLINIIRCYCYCCCCCCCCHHYCCCYRYCCWCYSCCYYLAAATAAAAAAAGGATAAAAAVVSHSICAALAMDFYAVQICPDHVLAPSHAQDERSACVQTNEHMHIQGRVISTAASRRIK